MTLRIDEFIRLKTKLDDSLKRVDMNDFACKKTKEALFYWSCLIRFRDRNLCQDCNSSEKLIAHHIKYKKEFPELAFDLDNGVTLCKHCHMMRHGWRDNEQV